MISPKLSQMIIEALWFKWSNGNGLKNHFKFSRDKLNFMDAIQIYESMSNEFPKSTI